MEITLTKSAGELIITGEPSTARVIEISPWSPEEAEHYSRTGQTPLELLHRNNLAEMWASSDSPS